jgi:hypothetical protein
MSPQCRPHNRFRCCGARAPAWHYLPISIFIFLLAIITTLPCNAQLRDPILRPDTSNCTIPFNLVGKLIIIQATADTSSGNFILDTGAPGLVLNNTYFRRYPVMVQHNSSRSDVNGTGGQQETTVVPHFQLGTMHYYRMDADMVSLGHIERARGLKIMGLVGVAFFKECEMTIDYVNNLIHLRHITKKEAKTYQNPVLNDTSRYAAYPIELKSNRILLKMHIGKRDLRFAIDLAAETSILDSRLPDKVLDSVTIEGRILLTGTGTRQVEALSGQLSGLQLGNIKLPLLPVIITHLEYTCFGGMDCINGVLGYDFLSRNTIVINFRKRILYILK